MGGKRPDQYRIDSNEGRTTDHKFLPDEPREADLQDRLFSEHMESTQLRGQPIPPDVLEPHAELAREKQSIAKRRSRRSPRAKQAGKPRKTEPPKL